MIKKRLNQESTWRGLIAIAGVVAIILHPERIAEVLTAVLGLQGSINIIKKD